MTFASVALVAQDAAAAASAEAAKPLFFEGRGAIGLALLVVSAAIVGGILWARSGGRVTVRRMAGLDAVDEAVGRATEMGRPILYVPGIMDMDNIMTVAGVTILGHVARTVAEYDADLEVPTSRSIVMASARAAVQSAYLAAGRPEGYNPDRIYYISDEQFAYVAATSGMMARRRPAACFYFGCFFAESLILAENGNAIGAIQIAGTAETAQLPFFVAACDYTLIGEEFFAASAYLSGEPDQLGTLLGQDLAKAACWLAVIAAAAAGTVAALAGNESLAAGVAALRQAMGGGG